MAEPNIVLWDIETSQNVVATFQNWGKHLYIPPSSIIRERQIICAAWKRLDKKTVHAVSAMDDMARYRRDPYNDYHVVKTMHGVLSEADMLVHHNGRAFDRKYLNARMAHHGFRPLPPMMEIDTCLVAKKQFLFNYANLDYLAKFLGVGTEKIHTAPGLWIDWLTGEKSVREKALHELVVYNKHDVIVLEAVFERLRPYIATHINRALVGDIGCPRCGSLKVQHRGIHKAITRTYDRFQCQSCGGWFRDTKTNSPGTKTRVI